MKTVLITGISKGIGCALADKFLKEGFEVIGTSTSGEIDCVNNNLKVLKLDLADNTSIEKCAQDMIASNKKIDILINNAGVLLDDEETHLVVDKLRQTLEVNLIGTVDFTEHMIPIMDSNGHIVNISSQAGSLLEMDRISDSHSPYHYPAYKISKCALNMYTRTLAARLTHEGSRIIVSAIHPGWVRTEMGGNEAPITPDEAACDIFKLATSRPETGQFWHKGQKYYW